MLVCMGSAAIIVAFQKLSMSMNLTAETAIRMDPARAAAGVITGIGFLGAGSIIKSRDFVRGLTTAASIWVVSVVGVVVGLGEYRIALMLTLLILMALYLLHLIPIRANRYHSLHLVWRGDLSLLDEVTPQLRRERIQIKRRRIHRSPNTGLCRVILFISLRDGERDSETFLRLQEDARFDEVTWS
jgi:putative Mg2+ transporter-C (MgtC) family protein